MIDMPLMNYKVINGPANGNITYVGHELGPTDKLLTEEEYRQGQLGVVYFEEITGKIYFKDSLNILEKAFKESLMIVFIKTRITI